jgi:hypothetical protein
LRLFAVTNENIANKSREEEEEEEEREKKI